MRPQPWFGEVPPAWRVGNIRQFASMRTGHTPSRQKPDFWVDCDIPWFTLADVWQLRQGARELGATAEQISAIGLANSAAELLPAGTVVLSRTASVGFSGIMPQPMATSQDYWNWVPKTGLRSDFLWYQFQAMKPVFEQLMIGSTHRTIYKADAAAMQITVPSLESQTAIVRHLDRETAQIDAFIAKNKELVNLLAERRDSLWTELYDVAATSGELVPLRRLVASIVDGPFGSSLTSAHYSTSGTRVIRLGNIGINKFKHADEAFISTEYATQLATHAARAGDVIVAGLGDERMPLGRACVLPDVGPSIVKADCYRVRPNRLASAEYLAWVLSAPPTRGQMRLLARGTTRLRLNTSVVRDVQVPVPSASLQADLVARFGRRAEEIDAASSKAESGIDLARERRAALISAAVTGKIDVGVAA